MNVWFLEEGVDPRGIVEVCTGGSCTSATGSRAADCGMNSFVLLGFQSDALALKLLADVERFGMLFHGDVDADNEEVLV